MNLQKLGVQEMNAKEVLRAEGGSIFYWFESFGGFNFANIFGSDYGSDGMTVYL